MPVSGAALGALVESNVNARFGAIHGYYPLQFRIPHYYIEFSQAIGQGIINAGLTINFTTSDSGEAGSPLVTGTGSGIGIITDPTFFVQDLYSRIRNYVIADYGRTLLEPYLPRPGSVSQYTLALCNGINDSFLSYYPTAWTLSSTHPDIYMGTGTINDGQFSGLSATAIQAAIISGAPDFGMRFWPRLAQAISESYVALIEQHSTGTVTITGSCSPSGSQVCGISSTGTGNGTAT